MFPNRRETSILWTAAKSVLQTQAVADPEKVCFRERALKAQKMNEKKYGVQTPFDIDRARVRQKDARLTECQTQKILT